VGVATGLAWTEAGGELLPVETTTMPGKGSLQLTGKLGDVMQESAKAALSYLRSRGEHYNLPPDFYKDLDLHIHVPEGAIPKDGPSAGVTMATALASVYTQAAARTDTAMTGEITLTGLVLPIGGVKEKTLAARRAGVRRVILPRGNEKDLRELPDEVRREMEFVFADRIEDVLGAALPQMREKLQALKAG
jgi:ATP-dependent Lon protease